MTTYLTKLLTVNQCLTSAGVDNFDFVKGEGDGSAEDTATNTHVNMKEVTCDGTNEDTTTNKYVNIKCVTCDVLMNTTLQIHMLI